MSLLFKCQANTLDWHEDTGNGGCFLPLGISRLAVVRSAGKSSSPEKAAAAALNDCV